MDHDHAMMGEALAEARLALDEGILPVGAVLTLGAAIIGRGRKFMDFNHLDHAEMIAFRRAFTGNYPFRRGDPITLYTTLEPCVMCWGTLRHLPVRPLVYAMPDAYGGCAAADLVPSPPRHRSRPVDVIARVRQPEARALFRQFLETTTEPFWVSGGAPEFAAAVRAECS